MVGSIGVGSLVGDGSGKAAVGGTAVSVGVSTVGVTVGPGVCVGSGIVLFWQAARMHTSKNMMIALRRFIRPSYHGSFQPSTAESGALPWVVDGEPLAVLRNNRNIVAIVNLLLTRPSPMKYNLGHDTRRLNGNYMVRTFLFPAH